MNAKNKIMNIMREREYFLIGESWGKRIFPSRYKMIATPTTIQSAMKISLLTIPHCLTRSALDKNFIAIASSINPSTTFTEFNQPPDLGSVCSQFGKMANNVKGNASDNPKPAMPNESCMGPLLLLIAPTNSVPKIGPVQENETMASVNAMKNIPAIFPLPDLDPALFASWPGNVISKYPKNERANRTKIAKKNRFSHAFVEILFRISGEA